MALTKITGEGVGSLDAITIGDGTAADKKILFDGNAQDYHIGLDDSSDSLTIGLGSTLGTTSHMIFDANGHITKPLQPAFQARPASNQTNIAINGNREVVFGTEIFDNNGDFSSNTFTAPVTGKYLITYSLYLENLDTAANYYESLIKTSNRTYYGASIDPDFADADWNYHSLSSSCVVDMDANDTATIEINQSVGTAQTDIATPSFFSGALIC